jgi:hypothetical protein
MSGAISPLPQYVSVAWCLVKKHRDTFTSKVISWSRALLEKLTVIQLVKKFPTSFGTRWYITCSEGLVIGPYPEPVSSTLHHSILLKFESVNFITR